MNNIMQNLPIRKLLIFAIIIAILITIITIPAVHAEEGDSSWQKYYKSIEIYSGDTLWSIAEEYMTDNYKSANEYIEEVKYMNNLKTDHITAGKCIVIPYYETGE